MESWTLRAVKISAREEAQNMDVSLKLTTDVILHSYMPSEVL